MSGCFILRYFSGNRVHRKCDPLRARGRGGRIWRLDYKRSVVTYIAKDQDEELLTNQLLAIGAPLKSLVTV